MIRRSLRVLLALAISASACGEYPRNNPYEPSAIVTITITGPDQLAVAQPPASYTLTYSPTLPGVLPGWVSSNVAVLQVLGVQGDGTAVVRALSPGTATLTVALGPHQQTKRVIVQ